MHQVTCTAANLGDVTVTHEPLHGKEDCVLSDGGYNGAEARAGLRGSKATFLLPRSAAR